ncbi:hypothetical protein C7271_21655 [filamentous cyanobacterium CCP5]|nr:hypothetical protein C7271_21655 [filamentous cyanobacterium CCP5]
MNYRFRRWMRQQRARYGLRRGLDAISKGNLQDALARLTLALNDHPYPARVYLAFGSIHWQQGDIPGAIAAFSEAIRCDPACVKAYGNRALLQAEQGNLEAALADWQTGLSYSPRSALLLYNRGLFHLQQQNLEAALEDLNGAIAANPNLSEAYFHRGNLLRQLGRWSEAIKDWELALCNDLRLEQARDSLLQVQQGHREYQLSEKIQRALAMPELRVAVEKKGNQLDIAVQRPKGTGINYMTLPDRIRARLVPLQLPDIRQFKLIGKVGEQNFPEWQQIYKLYQNLPCPPTHWRIASLTALLLFPPLGIPALVYALQVRQAYRRGDYPAAMHASHTARALSVTGSALMSGLLVLGLGYLGADRLRSWVQSMEALPGAQAAVLEPTPPHSAGHSDLPETSAHILQRADESRGYRLEK